MIQLCASIFLPAKRHGIELVLLRAATLPLQLCKSDRSISYPIRLLPGGQEESSSPPLHQNEAGRISNPSLTSFRPNLPKSLIALKRSLRSHSSVGCKFHPLYKYLLKHNIAKMSEVLSRAQPYIQLEEAMKASSNQSMKSGEGGGKSKSPYEASDHLQD